MIDSLITIFLHLDQNMVSVVQEYGMWTYAILFCVTFLETGLVVMPFLPGDSLLFVGGAAAASGILELPWLFMAIILGAVLGDTLNYWIGNYIGLKVFLERFPTIVKKEHIDQTYVFYEKYGGATIFVARFVPVVRTFAPFLAGVGSMHYPRFLFYNVLGATVWVAALITAGYYFGSFTIVKENMSIMIIAVIGLSLLTILFFLYNIISAYIERQNEVSTRKE